MNKDLPNTNITLGQLAIALRQHGVDQIDGKNISEFTIINFLKYNNLLQFSHREPSKEALKYKLMIPHTKILFSIGGLTLSLEDPLVTPKFTHLIYDHLTNKHNPNDKLKDKKA